MKQNRQDDSRTALSDPPPPLDQPQRFETLPHERLQGATRSLTTFAPEMFEVLAGLKVAAAHNIAIFLIGETGVGKTYLAQLLHEMSSRRDERFLVLPCGATPSNRIESEMFGHAKGAFPDAVRAKLGKFCSAGDGTLLLDEIDALPPEQQATLLRVIETGEFEPVGSNTTKISQARIIAASNYDLDTLVEAGAFRRDLYYRLNVLTFQIPPLRARPHDIDYLAHQFARAHSREHGIRIHAIDAEFLKVLQGYAWPGNIRELENVIRRAVLYCRDGVLRAQQLDASLHSGALTSATTARAGALPYGTLGQRVDLLEQRIVADSLRRNGHRRQVTARELGISRVTLYNKMKKFGMLTVAAPIQADATSTNGLDTDTALANEESTGGVC